MTWMDGGRVTSSIDDVSRETVTTPPAVSRETAEASDTTPTPRSAGVSRETSEWRLPAELADSPFATEAAQAVQMENDRQTNWPRPHSGQRIIAIANQKGGVGKTTSTVNLAAALALHGLQVLVVDLDPQGNASTALGVAHPVGTPSMYDVLVGETRLVDVVVRVDAIPGLYCAPATIDQAGAEVELTGMDEREYQLRKALATANASMSGENNADGNDADENLTPYDYILIDCPPSLGQLTVNGLVAAQELLLPIQCEFYALEGLAQLLGTVDLVKAHLNPGLQIGAVLLTMYDARTRLADQVAAEVRRHFGDLVLPGSIPRGVRISEAPGFGQTVMTYDPGSRGALAYLNAARILAENGAIPPELPSPNGEPSERVSAGTEENQ